MTIYQPSKHQKPRRCDHCGNLSLIGLYGEYCLCPSCGATAELIDIMGNKFWAWQHANTKLEIE